MNSKIKVSDRESHWSNLLTSITDDTNIINFIIDLDNRYEGMQSYLSNNDMPGYVISDLLRMNKFVHPLFLKKIITDKFHKMKFFYVGVKVLDSTKQWNPIEETLFSFTVKNKANGIIFFEDKDNAKYLIKHFCEKYLLPKQSI